MAKRSKRVDRRIPANLRNQTFRLSTDFAEGDILQVEDSLGHCADQLTIDAGSGIAAYFRFNVLSTVFPNRPAGGYGITGTEHLPWLTSGIEIRDRSGGVFTVEHNTTFEMNRELPIRDIEILAVSGLDSLEIWVA